MNGLFSFGLLVLLVLVVVIVGAAVYGAVLRRRGEEAPLERDMATLSGRPPGGRPSGEEMKIHLYSLDEYESELGGDAGAARAARARSFVAALKAYRPVEDEWYDYPPTGRRACWNSPRRTTRWTARSARCSSRGSRAVCRTRQARCCSVTPAAPVPGPAAPPPAGAPASVVPREPGRRSPSH